MKRIMLLLSISFLLGFSVISEEKRYSISDKEYKYTFFTTNKKAKRLKYNKKYFWYKSQKIHGTVGNYNGVLLDGDFIRSYRSNQLAEKGVFKKGLKQKVWVEWFENGNKKTITFWNNGIKSGKYRAFNEKGDLMVVGEFSKGKKNKVWINYATSDTLYYKDGIISVKPKSFTLKTKLFLNKIFAKDSLKPKKEPNKKTKKQRKRRVKK